MIEKLQKTYGILNSFVELNSKKFNFNNIKDVNELLDLDLNQYANIDKETIKSNLSNEHKDLILNIISKIDTLESKILPKANLVNSFSENIK
ncbi:MAG: hypothetical protein O3A39_04915 [Proteobacteria bacterium]|nr:hypothetical protein [Pseudomonadota bacterium]MDA1135839.1 hypothetical protein [Pseudomonadota bacterium]